MLHEDGVDLNGVVLQSSILDYSQASNPVGLLPTLAADARYHKKVTLSPYPSDLPTFMNSTITFDREKYAGARATFALGAGVDPGVLQYLSDILGISPNVLESWKLDPSIGYGALFLTTLLQDKGLAVGAYDGRVTATDTGIAQSIDPNSGGNDPTMTAVGGVYTTMWNVYLNDELKFTATSPFMDLNDQAFLNWNFDHIDPTGEHVGGIDSLYTAGDLAAAMALNPYLKVFSANGYYDAVTPFFQTILNFENMPLEDPQARQNLTVQNYPSGHMIYLDNESRSAMKHDLAAFYKEASPHPPAVAALRASEPARHITYSRYRRRFTRTPY
jgi:carboxypeptidase C (cathepsin A)